MQAPTPRRAILLVDHGSRRADAQSLLADLARRIAKTRPADRVAIAHMEFGAPDVPTAITQCVDAGIEIIIVHPFFLNTGLHIQDTIPSLIEASRARHSGIEIVLAEHLGLHDGIVTAVLDRIEQAESKGS